MGEPGRPSLYTQELADEITRRLSEGEPLAKICRDDHMPAVRTVSHWKEAHPSFLADFARAREEGADALAVEALDIADDGRRDYTQNSDGRDVVDYDHIQRSKLRVDTRLKLLAKWFPARYGDKVQLADADGNKLPPAPQFVVAPILPLPRPDVDE